MAEGKLSNRVAIVTGAARGIGRAMAARLIGEGAELCVGDIDADVMAETAAELREETGSDQILDVQVDHTNQHSVKAMVGATIERFGALDILVNNAAITDWTPYDDLTYEHYLEVQRINVDGALLCTMAASPHLENSGHARVVNVSSIMGERAWPDSIPYCTAKGGLINMTRALAADLGPRGIIVNAICPGFINTRMAKDLHGGSQYETEWFQDVYIKHGRILLRRHGEPADIAGPTLFLCSDDCAYITGQVLLVDGGITATF